MWPFTKRHGYKNGGMIEQAPGAVDGAATKAVKCLEGWRQRGETFTYLGRTCVVTGYCRWVACGFGFAKIPELQADYVDYNGVIRPLRLSALQAAAIMQEQPNA